MSPHLFPTVSRHALDLARLSGPVILSRAGLMVMMFVDAIMVGRFSTQELAYQAIGLAPLMFVMVTSFGLLMGTLVRTAYKLGAGTPENCGSVWQRSLGYSLFISAIGFTASCFGTEFLILTGQEQNIAAGGGEVILILGYSIPFMLVFITSAFFLDGLKRPKPGMYLMIAANILNLALNWVLVFGNLGLPAMGASGSAWASFGVRVFSAIVIVWYIWNLRDRDVFGIRKRNSRNWSSWAHQRKIGYSAGLSNAIESAAFSAMNIFAGLLGALPLAAFSVAFNNLALVFMIALGIGTATAVCVGNAHGRGDVRDMAYAGWTGLGLTVVIMTVLGLPLILFPDLMAGIFSKDLNLISAATPMIAFLSFVLIADGSQSVMAHALRGRSETWIPAVLHVVSYLMIMIPSAWLLSHTLGRGAIGLFEAMLIASLVSVSLLSARFWWLCRRETSPV